MSYICFFGAEVFLAIIVLHCIFYFVKLRMISLVGAKKHNQSFEGQDTFRYFTLVFFLALLILLNSVGLTATDPSLLFVQNNSTFWLKCIFLFFVLVSGATVWCAAEVERIDSFEYFFAVLCAILSSMLILSANDLLSFFICLEYQSLAFYILCSAHKDSFSAEAGLKYFVTNAIASCFILFGIASLYGFYGVTNIPCLVCLLNSELFIAAQSTDILFGLACLVCGLLFKMPAAPFHAWFPQIYDSAPLSTTIIFIIYPKFIVFTWLVKICILCSPLYLKYIGYIFFVGLITAVWGCFRALSELRLKKLLVYSSLSQVSLPLFALADFSHEAVSLAFYYLFVYILASILVWGVFVKIARISGKMKSVFLTASSIVELLKSAPALAVLLLVGMIVFIGLPPLYGFFSKVGVFAQLSQLGCHESILFLFIITLFGMGYYFFILKSVYYDRTSTNRIHEVGKEFYTRYSKAEYAFLYSVLAFLCLPLVTGEMFVFDRIVEYFFLGQ